MDYPDISEDELIFLKEGGLRERMNKAGKNTFKKS